MAFKLSDKTKKKGQFLLKTYSDDGTKTQGTKYDRARAVLGTDKVFDAEKTYEITNQSGQVLGTVSHDAKKAIENNKLDSYKPKNDEEKRVIDSLMQEAYKNSPYGKIEEGLKATKEIEATGKNSYLKDSGVMGYQVKKSGNKYVVAPRTLSGFEGAFDYMKSNTLESFDKKEDAEKYVTKLEKANDFKIGSRYESTAKENVNDVKPSAVVMPGSNPMNPTYTAMYNDTGFEDVIYDYINGNKLARNRLKTNEMATGQSLAGYDKSFLDEMTKDEVSVFNYLYKNMGKEKAHEYLKGIQGTLTGRQRNSIEEQLRTEAKKNPISSSLFTILTSPAKGLSYIGQIADYTDDGKIDQNAGYNKFSYSSSAIRDEVSKKVEKNWGKAGSWGYQLGMSMGDMLMNSAVGAGNKAFTLALMGAGAAADGVISAKDRGLSDNQAFLLGTINGAVEVVTEKMGYDKLFKADILEKGIKKYIFGNIASNAAEEGTAAFANTITDIFVSKDKSEWSQDVAAYMKEGDSKAKAIGKAVGKQALNIGLDALGGALMGGTISGVNAGTTYVAANNSYTTNRTDIRNIINTGLGLDKNSDAYKNAVKLQEKQDLYETGYAKKGVSDYEVVTQEWKNHEETTKAQGREVSEVREEVIKTGLESPKDSEAYKNAKTLSKKKNVSDYDLGKQYLLNVEQVDEETTEVKTKFAPGGATENVINLEKSMAREGVAEKDIEKIVSDAVTLESSLTKTPTTNMTAEMVERANGTITTQAKNNLAMNGAKNADYWGIYGTNLKILSKNDKMIDEGFIDTYAEAYAEGLKEGNSISYHSLAENTDNVAKALKNYVLTGAVPETMRGTNIVEKAGENLKGIIQSAVGSLSSAHKIVYGEGTNIARQAEAIKSGDFSSVISGESNNYKTTPSFNNAINTDEIRMVMNSTFKEGAMENIAEIMSATTGGVDMGVFAYKLAEYYQKNGNITPFRKYFADGGIAVTKTFENMARTNQTVTVKEKTAPPETSILDMEEVENETTTEETTKEAENETGEVEKSAEGKKEKAKTESEKDKEIKESVPEKEEEKAKDNSGKALKRLGRKGKAAYQKVLEIEQSMHSEMSEYEVLREFEKSYRAGREGVKNTDGSRLTEQSRKVAEKAGKADRKNKSTAKENVSKKSEERVWQPKKATEKTVEKESVSETKGPKSEKSSDSRENIEVQGKGAVKWSSLHPRQQKAIVFMEGFAKAANMKLVFVANSPDFNGAYDISGDTMYLDIYAGVDPMDKLSDLIIPTASHELTHWMHYQAPVAWSKLSGAVFKALEEVDGISREQRIKNEIERLKGKGLVHNKLVAEDEIVARACEDMLAKSEVGKKVFNSLSESEQKTITGKIKSIIQALKDWISDFLSSYKPSNRIEAEKIRQAQDKVNEILKLWNEGIAKSVEVSKAETKAEAFIGNDVYEQYGVEFDVDQNADEMLLSEKDNKITVDDVKNIQSIGRKSVNDFTSEDISKTKKIARKYFEEMGVKSPFFRAWFGDWRVNDKTPVHIVTEKGAERGTTKNKDTNWDIQISGKVFNETKGHKAPNNTNAVSYLDYINSIVENAILLDSYTIEDGKAKSENSAMMHSMYAVADIGNGLELIKLYVEELNDVNSNGTIKRSYQLQNLNKIPLESKRFSDNSLASSDQRYGYSVSDLYAFVKQNDKNFNPKSASKVVNEDGTPKVVYHGTSKENGEFYVFDYNQAKKKVGHGFKQYGKGNYFSANKPKENSIFNGRIIESYLSIKNPYYSDGQLRESLKKSFGWNTDNMSYDEIQNKMRQMGYDGVISNKGYMGQVFVSFDSTQIKSATDNIGTFDKNNPDIRYSEKESLHVTEQEDADYMSAVKKGDMETAQKMVDEEAKKARFPTKVYHGTNKFGFTKNDVSKSDDGISFFATDSLDLASTYSGVMGETSIKNGNSNNAENQQRYAGLVKSFVDTVNEVAGTEILTNKSVPFDKYLNRVKKGKMNSEQLSQAMTDYTADVIEQIEEYTQLSQETDSHIWDISTELEVALYGLNGAAGNYGLYANTDNFLEVEGNGSQWSSIPFDKIPSKTTANTREIAKWAKDNGYSGVLFKNIYDIGYHGKTQKQSANVYAFFSPQEQTKSADPVTYDAFGRVIPPSKRFNKKNRDIRYSEKSYAPTFYSHMSRVIDDVKQEKLGASSVVPYLKGKGVKNEEIKWSGIETFLEGKKSVTKAELQEFAQNSMLQIETKHRVTEVPYSEEETLQLEKYEKQKKDARKTLDNLWDRAFGEPFPLSHEGIWWEGDALDVLKNRQFEARENTPQGQAYKEACEAVKQTIKDEDYFGYDTMGAAFKEILKDVAYFQQNYEMTSGSNAVLNRFKKAQDDFRSVDLKTLIPDSEKIKTAIKNVVNYNQKIFELKTDHRTNTAEQTTRYDQYTLSNGENYRELLFKLPDSNYSNDAMRNHWGEEGVLAHARVQDFKIDGKKMLFIEEIQSDWHNEGHQKGYSDKVPNPKVEKAKNIRDMMSEPGIEFDEFDRLRESFEELQFELEMDGINILDYINDAVPDAPFRDNYHEYVLKNIIRMAAEQGYDSIGWTTADIQSKRWSDDYAEGYRIEYDQDIPKFLNKYGKKWGAKVGKSEINGTGVWSMDITDSMKDSVLYEGQTLYSPKDKNISESNRADGVRHTEADTEKKQSPKKTVAPKRKKVTKTPEQIYRMQNRDIIQFIRDEYDKSEKFMPRIEDVKKSANKLGKGYTGEKNLAYEFGKLYKEVKAAIAYGERTDATEQEIKRKWDEVQNKIDDIAMDIVMNNEVKNDENWQMIKDFRRYLHGRTIKVPAEWHADFDAQGGIDGFRKHNRGRFFVSYTKGESIETLYPEMRGMFGNLLPDISNPADQLIAISDFLDEMAVTFENPYDSDIEAAAESMSLEIMADMLVNIREVGDDVRSKRIEKLHRVLQEERLKRYHALNRVKERQERKIKEATEKRKAAAEKKADMAARQRLLAVAKKLESLSKKSKPEQQAEIQKLIGHLDLAAVSITDKKLEHLKDIKNFYDGMKNDPDFIEDKRIEKTLERLEKKQISDLDLYDVQELTDVLLAIEHKIRTDAYAIETEDKRKISVQAKETMRNIENSSGSKASGIGKFADNLIVGVLTPTREARRITGYVDNDPLYLGMKNMQSGQVDMFDYAMKAEKMFEKYTNDKKFMESITGAKAKTYTYNITEKDAKGREIGKRKIELTAGMRISLLLHNLNSSNQGHMKIGGVSIPDAKLYKAGKMQEAYARGQKIYLHPSDIKMITKDITEKEREYARVVWRYYNEFAKSEINRVSLKLKGYEIARVKNYFPIDTNKDFSKQDFELMNIDGTIEGMGFLKERIEAKNPIMLIDVASVLEKSIRMNSKYVGLAIPVRNMSLLLGKSFSEYGEATSTEKQVYGLNYTMEKGYYGSVMDTIGTKWGINGKDYINKIMQDMQGKTNEQGPVAKVVEKIGSRYVRGILSWNPKVAFNQVASIPSAIPEVGFKALARSMFDWGKVDTDLIAEYTPLQYMRSKGAYDTTIADMARAKKGVLAAVDNIVDKVDLMTWTDTLMTRKLWKAAIYNIKNTRSDLKEGTREFYEAVADVYTDIMQNTQPNVSMMERPQFLRADETTKMVMTFQGEPLKNVNLLYESAGNLRAKARQLKQIQNNKNSTKEEIEKAENRLKQAKSQFGVTVISQILSSLAFAVEKSIFQLLYGKVDDYWDDEEEKVTFCSWLVGTLKDTGINFFTQIPFAAHIVDFVSAMIFKDEQYYPYTPLAFSSLEDLESEVLSFRSSATDLFTGKGISGKEFGFAAYEVIEKASNFLGIPTKNVVNFAKSMIKLVEKNVSSNKYVGDYAVLKYEEALTRKKLIDGEVEIKATNSAYDILYRAMRDGDKEGYDIIFKDLVDRGISYTDIESAMQDRAKKDENFNLDTSLNMYAGVEDRGETEKYEKYIDSAEELGIDEELLKKVVDTANSKKKYKERKTDAEKIINNASLDFESEEFLKGIISDSYSVNDLSKEQYIEYSKTRATYLQKVDNEIDSEGMSEREFRKVYNKASDLAEEYAFSQASDGEYSMRAKWMYYAVDAEEEVGMTTGEFLKVYEEYGSTIYSTPSLITYEVGYNVSDYLEFRKLTKDIKGDKDENGKDIEGRTKQDKIINVLDNMNVSNEVKAYLYSTEYKSNKNNPWSSEIKVNYKEYTGSN